MLSNIVRVVIALIAVAGVLWAAFVVSFRTRFQPVQKAIRRMNQAVVNPWQLRTAGQPGAYASVVHHIGRTSGASYRTPVVAEPVDDGYVIALPYGPDTDWVKNVLAAGTATVEHEGRTTRVVRHELVPADAANPHFPPKEQRMHRLFGIDDFLLLRPAGEA